LLDAEARRECCRYDAECYVKFMGIPVGLRDVSATTAAADGGLQVDGLTRTEAAEDCESTYRRTSIRRSGVTVIFGPPANIIRYRPQST